MAALRSDVLFSLKWPGMSDATLDLEAQAVAVSHLADHFRQLKQRAESLLSSLGASARGYFTPSEDEQVRQLLASYWHSRNALLELIQEHRAAMTQAPSADPAAAMLVLASACLLVDMARFAREAFDDRPIVRAKLNEPEPAFGVPAGVYDTVQKSLTDPRNAWDLHQAGRIIEQNEEAFRRLAQDRTELAPVMQLIDQLRHRLSMSKGEYLAARAQLRSEEAIDKLAKQPFAALAYYLQQLAGCLVAEVYALPRHQPRLPRRVCEQLRQLLSPGDVCVNRKSYAVTNYFLPGYWPHTALYLGRVGEMERMGLSQHPNVQPLWCRLCDTIADDDHRVLESQKDGVLIRGLASPLRADGIAVIRPLLPRDKIIEALGRGLLHEGKPYDFDFDFMRSDRMVCSEVVYRSYEGVGEVRFELTQRAGRWTLSSQDLLQMALDRRHFQVVAVYTAAYRKRLVLGDQARQALAATL